MATASLGPSLKAATALINGDTLSEECMPRATNIGTQKGSMLKIKSTQWPELAVEPRWLPLGKPGGRPVAKNS